MTNNRFEDPIVRLYRKRAQSYDDSGIGGLNSKRAEAIDLLSLTSGDVVVDIGCGTGLNFPKLRNAVGPKGKIIGVDFTDAMLLRARQRIELNHWKNVELVQSDATLYTFPDGVDGIVSTFALTFIPNVASLIENGARALNPGKKWVVLDMAWPTCLPLWLRSLIPFLNSYGITADIIKKKPWEEIIQAMEENLLEFKNKFSWLGFFYIASGSKSIMKEKRSRHV